jgi:tetratricopeptide (TPR) repeat protein
MRAFAVSAILMLFMQASALALLSPKPVIDPRTPEGQFFQLLDLEDDSTKRLALIQQFAAMFPNHPANMWGWEQVQESQRQAGQHAKVIETAEKLLSMNPDHIDSAYYAWKAAGAKGDTALTAKWLERLNEMSSRIVASARPSNPADGAGWEASVSLAKQFMASKGVGLYAKALDARDPAKRIAILDELVKTSPDSFKAVDTGLLYFLAYRELGNGPKAVEAGLRVLAVSKNHEDILLFLADYYFQRRESGKSIAYGQRLIEVMRTKAKPDGLRDSDWARQKAVCNGSAYYMIGFLQMEAAQYVSSDAHFRAALGYIGDDQLKAIVLNSLGYVNLRLEKHAEALRFYKRCMEIKGPYQLQAAQNVDTLLLQHPEVANQ